MLKFSTSLLLVGLLTVVTPIALLGTTVVPAQAQTQRLPLKTYTIGNISFKVPAHWVGKSNRETILLYNQKPPTQGGGMAPKGMVKLTASTVNQSLEAAIKPSPRGMANTIQKTERLEINGQKAVRIYATSDEGDFVGSVATYVAQNAGQTAVLITFYQSAQVPASVNQIHQSMRGIE